MNRIFHEYNTHKKKASDDLTKDIYNDVNEIGFKLWLRPNWLNLKSKNVSVILFAQASASASASNQLIHACLYPSILYPSLF